MKRILAFLLGLLVLAAPDAVQAQFNYLTNADNTITITRYTGFGGAVIIPSTTNGLAVTIIGDEAFWETSVASVTIPASVTSIGDYAFVWCLSLTSLIFTGNAPTVGLDGFAGENNAIVYYLPGTTGWSGFSANTGLLAVPWNPLSLSEFDYTTNAGTITITGYTGPGGAVTMPFAVNGLPVTSIGDEAFFETGVTGVIIPTTVTSIGDLAFYGCSNLTRLTVPESVTTIGPFAFYGCSSLGSIAIPGNVTNVGDATFYACTCLTNAMIADGVISIGDLAFYGCTNLTSVTFPGSMANIGDGAFESCTGLTSVYFTSNPPAVSPNVFLYDNNATIYYLPNTTGWYSPFAGLPAAQLQSPYSFTINADETITIGGYTGSGGTVIIPAFIIGLPVTGIGDSAFENSNLTSVTIPGSVTSIGISAFEYCTKLTNATIDNGVTSILGLAFAHTALTSVTIPGSVTSIFEGVFEYCGSLTNAIFLNGVTGIPELMFENCVNLTSVALPGSVTSIGDGAFAVTGLTNVTIPASVTSIGSGAFSITDLTSLTIPAAVADIGLSAFSGCASLTNVTILDGVPFIPDYCFDGCTRLKTVTIPTSVTSIGNDAFLGCSSLSSITIPASVTNIGDEAFAYCSDLADLYFTANAPEVGADVFQSDDTVVHYWLGYTGWSSLFAGMSAVAQNPFTCTTNAGTISITGYAGPGGDMTIPASLNGLPVTTIGDFAFSNCSNLTNINILSGLNSVGNGAFASCSNLTTVYFTDDAPTAGANVFQSDNVMVYYWLGYSGWGSNFGGVPVFPLNPFSYATNAGAITITGYSGPAGTVPIPAAINGLPVTSIGDVAFSQCVTLTNIIIPPEVTYVGNGAFIYCTGLTNLTIPGTVTTLASSAFAYCTNLENVYFTGNAPDVVNPVFLFFDDNRLTVFYWLGCPGWSSSFGDRSTVALNPFKCTTNGNAITVTGYFGPGGDLTIPDTLNGLPVTSIGDDAFFEATVTSVTIPAEVTSIGDLAFYGCSNLASVNIPNGVTNIGPFAFYGCVNLGAISIPGSVADIGNSAFLGCSNLASVYFDGNAPGVGSNVFQFDNSATVYYWPGTTGWSSTFAGLSADAQDPFGFTTNADGITLTLINYIGPAVAVTIPATINGLTVTSIGDSAFYGTDIKGVAIPGSVTSIGDYAFVECSNLTSVTIADSVTNIGDYAFLYCTSLANVAIPAGVTSIGTGVFADCTSLTSVTIPGSVTSFENEFSGCTNLTSATIDNGVTSIVDYTFDTFDNHSSLTNITIPGSVTNIGLFAFFYCSSLTSITVNATNAFYSSINGVLCDKSQTMLILYPDGLRGGYTIPAGVTSIGDYAFYDCTSLTSVTIPGSVTSIEDYAFQYCTNLTNASIANGVTSIGYEAFFECFSLTGLTIPGSVTNIGVGAFASCLGLTAFTVDATSSFYSSVDGVLFDKRQTTLVAYPGGLGGNYTVPNGVTSIGDSAFQFCTNLTSVTIPASVTTIGVAAFQVCLSLTNVAIGSSVTSVEDYSFAYCGHLANIYFSGNAPSFGMDVFEYDPTTLYYFLDATGWPSSEAYVWQVVQPLYTYTTNSGTITITGFTDAGSTVILPSTINGLPVTGIGDDAFFKSSVTSVTIPSTIASIGDLAFYGATNLTSLTIPGSVTNIGQFAFYGCTSLGSLTITGNFTSISDAAFYGCTSLTNLTLTEGVTSLGDLSFYGCTNLASLTIPESVTNIGDGAFGYCTSLTNVFFDGNAPVCGSSVFFSDNATVSYVLGATGFSFPFAGLPVVVENPYYYTTNAGAITILGLTQFVGDMTIPITINGLPVTSIADGAFAQNTVTSVTIPGSVTSIGVGAFGACYSLTNANIGNGVTSIGAGAFNATALTTVAIPGSVTNIGQGAFEYCSTLTAITVDSQNAFYASVDGVLFDKSQMSLVEYPGGMAGSYVIPDTVTNIDVQAFASCTKLTSVTIPGSVTSIGPNEFDGCSGLTSLIIPGSITNLGYQAFHADQGLTSIFFKGNAPTADLSVFASFYASGYDPVTVYYLPGTTGWSNTFAGPRAVQWNPGISTGDGSFGMQNGQFGFNITNTADLSVVVEVCTNLVSPVWVPLTTNTLVNGVFYFSEPFQTNTSGRYYGLGLP